MKDDTAGSQLVSRGKNLSAVREDGNANTFFKCFWARFFLFFSPHCVYLLVL